MRFTNIFRVLLLALIAFPFVTEAQTETTVSGNLLYAKIMNGLNVIIMPAPGSANFEITLYIKTGSAYESDSLSGIGSVIHNILADKIARRLRSNNGTLTLQNAAFEEYCNTEHSVFKFTTNYANLNLCMYLLRDSIYNSKITLAEINTAVNTGLKQLEEAKYDKKKVFNNKVLQALYKQDHGKFEVTGNPNTLKNISAQAIKKFYTKYYAPNNTIAVVTGTFTNTVMRDAFDNAFNSLIKSEFNPETVTRIVDLRPVAYTTQFVVEDSSQAPEFQITWQFPGTSANQHESYCAYLLNAMLNDKNNYLYAKAGKLGCKKITVEYEANNFSGMLRFAFQPSTKNFFETYDFIMHEVGRLDKTLLNETMMNAGKLQFKKEYEQLKQTKRYPEWIAQHWQYNDETYFPSLLDSVMRIQEKEVKDFIVNYFNQSAHVVGLRINKTDRDSLKVNERFTDLDENVSKYVFKYRQNITDLERGEDLVKRDNLLQWLKINSDVNMQINGFSDEHEYNRATDDTIMQFIDSIPTFRQVKTEIVKKGYLRPEMMRALKIVKYLYDHGIAPERLSGTSMVFKSNNKQEALDNMKCTLTLNKYQKSPSLFEFHYGKKSQ